MKRNKRKEEQKSERKKLTKIGRKMTGSVENREWRRQKKERNDEK